MPKHRASTSRIDDLLASVTPDLIADAPALFRDEGIRVERILLELLRPDPVQPRRVLPERIHTEFHQQHLTPSQALRELVQIAQIAARGRGQPFTHVLELLPTGENDSADDAEPKLSPEEQLLRDLVNLAVTIRDDGQVNPLTVVDVSQGVTRMYRIETGERRYWATWLLRDFIHGYTGDGMVPCIIVPEAKSSVFRQARENTARAGLTAIAMARQTALLLLTVHGYEIPAYFVTNDFYRQALKLDLKGKQEYTEAVLSAMGGMSRMHFSRHKALLRLSDEAFELADRYNIEEKKLRYVLELAPELHAEMVQHIVDLNLTSKQVKDICDTGLQDISQTDEQEETLPKAALQMARFALQPDNAAASDIARALLQKERNVHVAQARLQALKRLIEEVEQCLREG